MAVKSPMRPAAIALGLELPFGMHPEDAGNPVPIFDNGPSLLASYKPASIDQRLSTSRRLSRIVLLGHAVRHADGNVCAIVALGSSRCA